MQVEVWLRRHGLERFAELFQEHDIDVDILASLTDADLREMGLPLGARKRFLHGVGKGRAQTPRDGGGERRQVTVLFCDLVDFTRLATAMDPEDLEDLMARVVDVCRKDVAQWGGHVGNYLGDGILVYFGWPVAYEDAPERAAHASHNLIRAVAGLTGPDGQPLAMRVGMATGLVLIGRRLEAGMGEVETVYGETPNLAARLEARAQPGEVLLDAATARLLPEGRFSRSDLGQKVIKGFTEPVGVWRLDGAETTSRPATEPGPRLGANALQGREEPMTRLRAWWRDVQSGQGLRTVWLSGEAGMGKSHLAAHFLNECRDTGGHCFELQCWPYNDHSTLYPVVSLLHGRAGVHPNDPKTERHLAFVQLAQRGGVAPDLFVKNMGDLLDLGPAPGNQSEDMRRVAWFGAIAEDLRDMSTRAPVLWVIEDIHWSDPVTLELLAHIRRACAECRVMILATSRPHFFASWREDNRIARLKLTRVAPEAAERIVHDLAGTRRLTPEIHARIIAASDGVPLFIHELTRELLDRAEIAGDEALLTIPETLQGVLTSRLDSAQDAKPLAQIASCIGRVFSEQVLGAVAQIDENDLRAHLDKLTSLALIEPLDDDPASSHIFRHALIQEAAYQSQPRSRRRQMHGAIADLLAARSGNDALRVANHLTAAERYEDAVEWWQLSGDRAVRRSAQREAADLYRRGLKLLDRLPASPGQERKRLALSLALGPVLSASEGYGAGAVGALFAQAAQLSDKVGTPEDRFAVRRGLWLYRQMSAQYPQAEQAAQDMLALAKTGAAELEANRALGATAVMLGKLGVARQHLERALEGYDAGAGTGHVARFGDDPGLACLAYLSSVLWYLGDPEAAAARCAELLDRTRRIDHPFSMARSLTFSAYTYHLMRDFDRLLPVAQEAAAHADKFEFPFHAGVGRILWGWGLCQQGQSETGWPIIEQGYAQYKASGSHMLEPQYLSLMAEIAEQRGDADDAWALSTQAMTRIDASREALVLPEVLRVHGELASRRGSMDEALALLDRAADVAREQGSVLCLIRSLSSMAKLDPSRATDLRAELARFDGNTSIAEVDTAHRLLRSMKDSRT